jgi:hypothetical protein
MRAVLLPHHPYDGEHADAPVLELRPASVVEVGLDVREVHGVEAHVTREGAIELLGDLEEGDGAGHFIERYR